ncbi:MAG: Mth938-like domain-containing protein [Thiohalomonadaceae bacterium]
MKFSQDTFGGGYAIRAYDAATVTIIGPGTPSADGTIQPVSEVLRRSFALAPDRLLRDWPPQQYADLHREHFATLLALEPEVVLLGTGTSFRYPSPTLLAPLTARGIGVEVMDSGAACRTYNVLAGEGRQVVAAILIDDTP